MNTLKKKLQTLRYFEKSVQLLPTPFYWFDLDQKYLGMNALGIKVAGASSFEKDFAGKTPYDVFPKEMAHKIVEHHKEVIRTGEILSAEESIVTLSTGEVKHFNATIALLHDDNGEIIGTIGTSIDITADKEEAKRLKRLRVFDHLDKIAQIIPANVYWFDKNNTFIGVNEKTLRAIGVSSYDEIIGKTVYEIYPKKTAEKIVRHHDEALRSNKTLKHEETINDVKTGEIKHFATIKAPLYDDEDETIGTLGISIDITVQKEANRLKLENAAHKAQIQEQEKFTWIADQVAHDIRSPLASLLMIVKSCAEIPETERVALREAANSIGSIADNLLNQYRIKTSDAVVRAEQREPVLLSAVLLQLLTDKQYQYKGKRIKFEHDFDESGQFAFIRVELMSFKRMISNLINNAVDAFEGKTGKVVLRLGADAMNVRIQILDNGKGIPEEVLEKIRQNIAITQGKAEGHGIGLTQVRETLSRNEGKISIDSRVGAGTQVSLEFPREAAQDWIAECIELMSEAIIMVLDDDKSIHAAWDARFEEILEQAPGISMQHFETGHEVLDFINGLSPEEKQRVFLLTDFELLKQELDGLHVVKKAGVSNTILVTSHYANAIVRERAAKLHTKILPKQLASDVPIRIKKTLLETALKQVDLILVEDDEDFAKILIQYAFSKDKVDYFQGPEQLRENLAKYPKDTRIYLDNHFLSALSGVEFAKELHALGYTRLYLLSGAVFEPGEVPDYVKVIRKDDVDNIRDW